MEAVVFIASGLICCALLHLLFGGGADGGLLGAVLRWGFQGRKLRRQGIDGPQPSLFCGNLPEMQRIMRSTAQMPPRVGADGHDHIVGHDYTSSLFPYFDRWAKQYGKVYAYSAGSRQHLYVNHPEMVKEMNLNMTMDLGKPTYITKALAPMLGNGILRTNGLPWAHQRKIVAPEFFMDKVKPMMGLMMEASEALVSKWEAAIVEGEAVVRVDDDLRSFSAEVISRACFGSSYTKGKEISLKLRALQKAVSKKGFLFKMSTFGKFLSTKSQREIKCLEWEIESLIWKVVQERVEECNKRGTNGKDLMQLMLDGSTKGEDQKSKEEAKHLVVDNFKNIYFAGHESTAVAAAWCLMLLALHPPWQARIRAEVSELSKEDWLHPDALLKMKSVTMVIQETLRLYPPAAFISREAMKDFKVGTLLVPKGVCLWTLIPTLHRDTDIWGPDANEFKPERFADGVSSACRVPQAYIPFGLGPRVCLGKNFAMFELKLILCLIVSKFSFTLSPKYKHCPAYRMIVEPGYGVHIVIKKLESSSQAS